MSALSYAIATSSPHTLLAIGFVCGVIASNALGLCIDLLKASREGRA